MSGLVPGGDSPAVRRGCICTWEQPPDDVVPLSAEVWTQTRWDPTCPFDGEGTERYRCIIGGAQKAAVVRCAGGRHLWAWAGGAPEFAGLPCHLWRCEACGKEHETFADAEPSNSPGHARIVRRPPPAATPPAAPHRNGDET